MRTDSTNDVRIRKSKVGLRNRSGNRKRSRNSKNDKNKKLIDRLEEELREIGMNPLDEGDSSFTNNS